jgi:AraC-like DNA-binding protein
MHYLSNNALTLQELIGKESGNINALLQETKSINEAIYIIEKFLLMRMDHCNKIQLSSAFINRLDLIKSHRGTLSIKAVLKDVKKSERTLQRLFLNHLGLSPKMFQKFKDSTR